MGYFVSVDDLGRKEKDQAFLRKTGGFRGGISRNSYLSANIGADNELTTVTCFKGNANLSNSGRTAVKVLEFVLVTRTWRAWDSSGDSEDNPKAGSMHSFHAEPSLAIRSAPKICGKTAGTPRVPELLLFRFHLVWLKLVGLKIRCYSKRSGDAHHVDAPQWGRFRASRQSPERGE